MILILRGKEPTGFERKRNNRLSEAIDAFNLHGAPSPSLTPCLKGYGDKSTKEALYKAQHKKCAWCERATDFSSSPVEHIRPKNGAWRNLPGQTLIEDRGHYWWLTWTWSNLVFSCVRCNDHGHKANYFPLLPGTKPVPTPSRQPPASNSFLQAATNTSGEHPLLIDPTAGVDPLDHIEWRPIDEKLAPRLWSWEPVERTQEGAATIAILKLKELTDAVADHVRTRLLPSIEEINGHLTSERWQEAKARWARLLDDTLSPSSPLSGPAWQALSRLMPSARRAKFGLAEPLRPGRR
jgi:hypothetical protein